jgi:hypothetical protein
MRTNLFLASALAASLATGCKWTDFDDLEDQTWVRSTQDPELGANDYAVAIAGVAPDGAGGTLVVISDDTANYSTLEYAVDGNSAVGTNPAPIKLGTQNIGAVADSPVFTVDDAGTRLALVERSINGSNFALLLGSPTAPAGVEVATADMPAPAPDAAAFAGTTLLFAAGSRIYRVPMSGMASSCAIIDHGSMPVQVAGMGVHGTNLVVWTKTGKVLQYSTVAFDTCTMMLPPLAGEITMAMFMPTTGARVHSIGNYVILSGKAASSRVAESFVIDMTSFSSVGTSLAIDGVKSSLVADLGGVTYFVAGIPDKSISGVVAGAIELYEFNTSNGTLAETPTMTLHDADPDSGAQFGRTVATMAFRGDPILVVGAAAEVFAYFRTDVYDHLP